MIDGEAIVSLENFPVEDVREMVFAVIDRKNIFPLKNDLEKNNRMIEFLRRTVN